MQYFGIGEILREKLYRPDGSVIHLLFRDGTLGGLGSHILVYNDTGKCTIAIARIGAVG